MKAARALLCLGALGCTHPVPVAPAAAHPPRARRNRAAAVRPVTYVTERTPAPAALAALGCPGLAWSRPEPPTPAAERVRALAFELGHACALMDDGRIRCAGENRAGELGPRPLGRTFRAGVDVDALGVTAGLSVSRRLTCARSDDGPVRCAGAADSIAADARGAWPVAALPAPATALSLGSARGCAVVAGALWCWRPGTPAARVATPDLGPLAGVDLDGLTGGCAWDTRGTVRCDDFARPIAVDDVHDLDAGPVHACARRADGTVRCWGDNARGQLGAESAATGAVVDPGLRCVTDLAVGHDHSCAALSDGSVWCWGDNTLGQRGDDSPAWRGAPGQVRGVMGARRVFAGPAVSCAALGDGGLVCWGARLWLPGDLPQRLDTPTPIVW